MQVDILSLFPEYFTSPLSCSIVKRAIEASKLSVNCHNIRDYSKERWNKVDDRPYGGGPGMVLMPEPVVEAIRAQKKKESKVVFLSPQGKPLTASVARKLAEETHLILLCGHYEGIDERVIESEVDEEVSIGDFVLTNGCLASLVLLDVVVRFIPGVLGDPDAASFDSFEDGLLDCPHYTKPYEFEGKKVPDVLLSGNHKEIALWRQKKKEEKTKKIRPDLWEGVLEKRLEISNDKTYTNTRARKKAD